MRTAFGQFGQRSVQRVVNLRKAPAWGSVECARLCFTAAAPHLPAAFVKLEVRAAGSRRGFMKLVNDTGMKRHTRHAFSFPVNLTDRHVF